jgi:Fe-S-cluster containining protein
MDQLHIPDRINFECSGCGNCCLKWPVPVTVEDKDRISALPALTARIAAEPDRLFRPLASSDPKFQAFSFTLEKASDGRCEFLTSEERCLLHAEYGPSSKPAMCQLFPYTFNTTPTGTYVSLSFASSGALFNLGRPLSEQQALLIEKWQLFKSLFPAIRPDWSRTQLIDGHLMPWEDYLRLDAELIRIIGGFNRRRVDQQLAAASRFLQEQLPARTNLERLPKMEARPKQVDQLLLKQLFELYLPDDLYTWRLPDLDAQGLMRQIVSPPQTVLLVSDKQSFGFRELLDSELGELDSQSEDLLGRFVYCRAFAKLYFGPGFANLSVLSGIHHLALLTALVRLKIKMIARKREGRPVEFLEVAEIIRALERRLSQVNFSKESVAILEVLLCSPERAERILSLAA